ncbi:hypothetical protein [Campylobacter fetus]|nr:hypothetical protein [Campylobacter fetus]
MLIRSKREIYKNKEKLNEAKSKFGYSTADYNIDGYTYGGSIF